MKRLGTKISLVVMALVMLAIYFIQMMVSVGTTSLVDRFSTNQSRVASDAFAKAISALEDEALTRAEMVAANESVVESVLTGDAERLLNALRPYAKEVDLITVCDAQGVVVARSHDSKRGDSVMSQAAIKTALSTGKGIKTIEKGTVVGISTRGSAAIIDGDGNIVGALTCGHDLSRDKYVDDVKSAHNADTTMFLGDITIASTVTDASGKRNIGAQADPEIAAAVIERGETVQILEVINGKRYIDIYSPLNANGTTIGMLLAGTQIDAFLEAGDALISQITIVDICLVLLIGVLLLIISRFWISKPLKKIADFALNLEHGEIGLGGDKIRIDIRSKDEVGALARCLESTSDALCGYIGEIGDCMGRIANGDFEKSSTYEFAGDFVAIKDHINTIFERLNYTMTDIGITTETVSSEARRISEGAQNLAKSTSEQAASVEELNSSVGVMLERVNSSVEMTQEASELEVAIKNNASVGSQQMERMINAVREINDASQSISKVMKVIDDIAFQTNILALNAAVEAARAGEQGKGFAVVAEEVRSLAAKSADAASDTAVLISNSMEKAELGTKIATETAVSLAEIIEGIEKSSTIIGQITDISAEQQQEITAIVQNLSRVSGAVQENSATSQESAATSAEMREQTDHLDALVSQFKLKRTNNAGMKLLGE